MSSPLTETETSPNVCGTWGRVTLSPGKKAEPVRLGSTDTLKLAFTVVAKDKAEAKGVQPHQTFVRFYDKQSGEEGVVPVRVAPNGKAKFELVRV